MVLQVVLKILLKGYFVICRLKEIATEELNAPFNICFNFL